MMDFLFEHHFGTLSPDDFGDMPVVAVNVTLSIDNYISKCGEIISAHVLAAAQEAWRMNRSRASECRLVLAYYKRGERRLVLGAFSVDNRENGNGHWEQEPETGRMIFFGYPTKDRHRYELHLLPPMAPGARNPVTYYD